MTKFLLITLLLLAGCATPPANIKASYVSDLGYQGKTCSQLAIESQNISNRAAVAVGAQQKDVTRDAVAVGVATVIFWPALFLAQGDGQNAIQLAQLRAKMQAIEKTSRSKGCKILISQ